MHYRPDVDGLRAVAVLSVVAFHAFPGALPGGFVGVDIFFVISGYLITGLLLREHAGGRIDLLGCYARRARRIFPALVLVLLACLSVGWSRLMPASFAALGWQAAGGAGFVSNVLLAGDVGYFDRDAAVTPLLHLWSLAIEEQFYLAWPVALIVALRSARPRLLLAVGYLVAILAGIASPINDPEAAYFSTTGRAWQLLTGAALAFWESEGIALSSMPRAALACAGAAMVAAAVWTTDRAGLYPGTRAMLPTFGAALVIASGPATWLARILSARPMVAVGLISFPLYLWHWPALVWLRMFSPEPGAIALVGAVLLSVAAAAATYLLVERPIRSARLPVAARGACAALFCAGMAGLAINTLHGVPERFPAEIRPEWTNLVKLLRLGTCLIGRPAEDAFAGCTGEDVALLGDSHAAVLNRGLTLTTGRAFGQFTSEGCPPWRSQPDCAERVDLEMAAIKESRPKTVIVHARWGQYDDVRHLEETITELRTLGVARVVVVGPVPVWQASLDHIVVDYWRERGAMPPERMPAPDQSRVEAAVQEAAQRAGAVYVSAQGVLCRADGCLTRIPGASPPLAYFDSNHLSESGAILLAEAILPRISDSPPAP